MKTLYCFIIITVIGSFTLAKSGARSPVLQQDYQLNLQSDYYDSAQAKYYKANPKLAETASEKLNLPSIQKMNVSAWGIIGIILGRHS
ncbi:uncharacterized protein LOC105182946 isoform X2 [Harpegnathos saltator]|uniref:uncharacterized protein LOC105182946 isoform X2 n=1 Tax=Harpegnathos saltator TaxID=610380 RepID=UPI00058FB5D8|nr:uncharacterized protein LOC105182946 isoform X2 [Harpegnathos saltator]